MAMLTSNWIRRSAPALAAALALAQPALAGDVSVKLDAGAGFTIKDSTDTVERLRVDEATGNLSRNGALFVHTTGTNNLFVGADAGNSATTGDGGNTGVGYRSLFSNTDGFSNSAFGDQALRNNTTGSRNTAFGANALFSNTTGNRNLAFGEYAGQNQTTGSDNIYLSNIGVADESGRIRIGTSPTHTATFIAGIHGADVGGSAVPVFVTPSGQLGTGGAAQPPWTAVVDADGNLLIDLAGIVFETLDGEYLGDNRSSFLSWNQDDTGFGWKTGAARGSLLSGSGLFPDSVYSINFNTAADGVSLQSDFAPQLAIAYEGLFSYGTNYDPQLEHYIAINLERDTVSLTSLSGGASFAVGEPVLVRRPGDGVVSGIGRVYSWSSPTLGIGWIRPGSATIAPAIGDSVETASTTTLTDVTGAAFTEGNTYNVYAGSAPCPVPLDDTQLAIVHLSAVSAPSGSTQEVQILQSTGAGTDLAAGNRICAATGNPTGLLGTVSKNDTGVIDGTGFTDTSIENQRLGPQFAIRTQTLTADFGVRVNQDQIDNAWSSFFTNVDVNNTPYVAILSNYRGANGAAYPLAIGDASHQFGSLFHGKIGMYDASSNYGFLEMADLATNRHYTFPDKDGTVAMLSDIAGGVGDVVSTGASVAGGIPMFTDATGDQVAASGATIVGNQLTLPPSASGPSSIKFYEDADDGSNSVTLTGIASTQDLDADITIALTKTPRAVAAGLNRGPVIGAVSNGTSMSTPEELCNRSYFSSAGVATACVAGSAKTYTDASPVAVDLIACGEEVSGGVYFETVCNVE